jgi:hypothetical protein
VGLLLLWWWCGVVWCGMVLFWLEDRYLFYGWVVGGITWAFLGAACLAVCY